MKNYILALRSFAMPRWARVAMRIVLVAFLVMVVAYCSLAYYIYSNNKKVLAQVTETLNENLAGTLTIGSIEPAFLQGFPRISLRLQNVALHDSLYTNHKQTLLTAGEIDLAVNALALMRGTVEIKKIAISNAQVNLFTDAMGYSNTSVFKKGKKKEGDGEGSGAYPQLRKFSLDNVQLAIDNRHKGKLYNFKVNDLDGIIDQKSGGWDADVKLDVLVNSMAFSTRKGSFIKNRQVQGRFNINFNEGEDLLTFRKNPLNIGGEDFTIAARIKTGGPTAAFAINIENKKILWRNAANLLSPNITTKLDMFNLTKPIAVKCDIVGDFNKEGDPLIRVNAMVENNTLETQGGTVSNCSFFGVFSNNHVKSRGFNDANSAIKLFNFKGDYGEIPFRMGKIFILDLEKPIAVGDFRSQFEMEKLRSLIDDGLLKFTGGTGEVAVNFRADIVDFKLSKPLINGLINIKNAGVEYVPRSLKFNDITVALNFTRDNLYISQINLKSGKSIVNMEGSIANFLNLYYTDPAKVVLQWKVYSPQLHLGEFMGFLSARGTKKSTKPKTKGNVTDELDLLFEKSNVDMKLRVDRLYYNNFYATDAKADVLLTDNGFILKNAGLKHAGGSIVLNGNMQQGTKLNKYAVNATVSNVDVRKFFRAFDDFGLESLKSNNLSGYLSTKADVSGSITHKGAMVPKSMQGGVSFSLKKGRLLNFEPVRNVGRFAFPFRNMDTITFNNLNGKFDIRGDKVAIRPMQINSSVLNMDVAGVYAFNRGTNITVDVPLRNPKKDKGITDAEELAKRRNRGIVLHLLAADDPETGKVKIKLGKGN